MVPRNAARWRQTIECEFLGERQDDDNEGYTVGWNEDTIRATNKPPIRLFREGDGEKLFGSSTRWTKHGVCRWLSHMIAYGIDRGHSGI
jgi:hypothetical protein